jgi:hypothetical protein
LKVSFRVLALAFLFLILAVCILSSLSYSAEGDSGWQIDLFCQSGGGGKDVPCPVPLYVGMQIILYAHVTYNQAPACSVLVAFQVDNPQGDKFLIAVSLTNAFGYATTNFTISKYSYPIFPSWWNSTATTTCHLKFSHSLQSVEFPYLIRIQPLSKHNSALVEIVVASGLIVPAEFLKKQSEHVYTSPCLVSRRAYNMPYAKHVTTA